MIGFNLTAWKLNGILNDNSSHSMVIYLKFIELNQEIVSVANTHNNNVCQLQFKFAVTNISLSFDFLFTFHRTLFIANKWLDFFLK